MADCPRVRLGVCREAGGLTKGFREEVLPNEFKQVETKTENVFRVEEMVKSLDKKRDDLKVINPVERITNESDKEGREGTTDGISLSAPKGDYEKGSP